MGLPGRCVVIDTETTGLRRGDRVVELAAIVLSQGGTIQRRIATLVDPGQPPRASHIHGITCEDLVGAPTFAGVARVVAHLLNGAVVVAHNLAFDWTVLRSEFRRLGWALPAVPHGICTLRLSRELWSRGCSLHEACERFGIETARPHRAISDASMAAQLFLALAAELGSLPPHRAFVFPHRVTSLPRSEPLLPRGSMEQRQHPGVVAR